MPNSNEHNPNSRQQDDTQSMPMEETRTKIRQVSEQTQEKLRGLSQKISPISDKINAIPDALGFDRAEKSNSYHPSGRGGTNEFHPSGIVSFHEFHPSDRGDSPRNAGTQADSRMIREMAREYEPSRERKSGEFPMPDETGPKDFPLADKVVPGEPADDRVLQQLDKHIVGSAEPLGPDDESRLLQESLDVNRTSDVDPVQEMKRWNEAKRESGE